MFDFAANTFYTRAVWIEFCFCLACRVKGVESGVTISSHIFSQAQFLKELPTCNIAANWQSCWLCTPWFIVHIVKNIKTRQKHILHLKQSWIMLEWIKLEWDGKNLKYAWLTTWYFIFVNSFHCRCLDLPWNVLPHCDQIKMGGDICCLNYHNL